MEVETLLNKLEQAEKIRLTQKEITSVQDEPTLTWKTQISLPVHAQKKGILYVFYRRRG